MTAVPTALAVAGTALMAITIFAPFRMPVHARRTDTVPVPPRMPEAPAWPASIDRSALGCDAPARIELADALGALQSDWAAAVLRAAYAEETDPLVRSAIASALSSSSQSLVT